MKKMKRDAMALLGHAVARRLNDGSGRRYQYDPRTDTIFCDGGGFSLRTHIRQYLADPNSTGLLG